MVYYIFQAEINLNGIGKWKGRHITCTVRLVPGPYDPLLEWPCDLNINIVLKDQPANRSQVRARKSMWDMIASAAL